MWETEASRVGHSQEASSSGKSLEHRVSPRVCRGTLLPDPKYDKVRCIAVATCDDSEEVPAGNYTARVLMFVDKAADASARSPDGLHEMQVSFLLDIVKLRCNCGTLAR